MKRCKFCGKPVGGPADFCDHDCAESYRHVTEEEQKKVKFFIAGMLAGFCVMLAGVLFLSDAVIALGILFMGGVVIAFPFTTPETNALLGCQKARVLGRALGVLLVAVALWMWLF